MFTFYCNVVHRILVDEEDVLGYKNAKLELEDIQKGVVL